MYIYIHMQIYPCRGATCAWHPPRLYVMNNRFDDRLIGVDETDRTDPQEVLDKGGDDSAMFQYRRLLQLSCCMFVCSRVCACFEGMCVPSSARQGRPRLARGLGDCAWVQAFRGDPLSLRSNHVQLVHLCRLDDRLWIAAGRWMMM